MHNMFAIQTPQGVLFRDAYGRFTNDPVRAMTPKHVLDAQANAQAAVALGIVGLYAAALIAGGAVKAAPYVADAASAAGNAVADAASYVGDQVAGAATSAYETVAGWF